MDQEPNKTEIVMCPTEIDETWLQSFVNQYGASEQFPRGRYEATLSAEDWLVMAPDEDTILVDAADYIVDDRMGVDGWRQTIKGTVIDAATVRNKRWVNHPKGPVVSLLNARVCNASGEEQMIDENPEHIVLVRLDRLLGDLQVRPLTLVETENR